MTVSRAFLAVHKRNLALLRRQKSLLIQAAIVPIAMLILSTLVYGGFGDAYAIGVVNQSDSKAAQKLEQQLHDAESDITPLFDVVTDDYDEARSLVDRGRLHTVVVIPPDYSSNYRLEVRNYNVNTDAMKNTKGRLQLVLNQADVPGAELRITNEMEGAQPHDVWRSAYLGGSAVLLALFFGAMLIAANLFLLERENSTHKEIMLTPLNPVVAGLANVLSALVVSTGLSLVPLGLSYWMAEFKADFWHVLMTYVGMLPVMVACAGLGIFAGHFLKSFRAAQPIITIGAMTTFFVSGGFNLVGYLPPAARAFSEWWPFSRIFSWFNPLLHGFDGLGTGKIVALLVAAVIGVLLVHWAYVLERRSREARKM
ncbi:ABC transporter permease [Streptomyces sulphureus]|uniref:ABC transporter permease n=1 Tax=Streptomyces sulphureus TaxID=47758 RepID=UPI00036A47FF|nr:ABC transporter permease [Streptomyces sulphureus]